MTNPLSSGKAHDLAVAAIARASSPSTINTETLLGLTIIDDSPDAYAVPDTIINKTEPPRMDALNIMNATEEN